MPNPRFEPALVHQSSQAIRVGSRDHMATMCHLEISYCYYIHDIKSSPCKHRLHPEELIFMNYSKMYRYFLSLKALTLIRHYIWQTLGHKGYSLPDTSSYARHGIIAPRIPDANGNIARPARCTNSFSHDIAVYWMSSSGGKGYTVFIYIHKYNRTT